MGSIIKKNSTTFIRCQKDEGHPFNRLSAKLYSLNGYQFAIMAYILSNNDNWNLVKYEICKRLGFPERKFLKAWKELEDMGYIQITRNWGCYHYTIIEDPGDTTGTGADCMDHTTGNSTSCISATLTTTNKNYYYNSTTSTDTSCYENEFNELQELYPASVTGPYGQKNILNANIEDCRKEYIAYLSTYQISHEDVITDLRRELDDRNRTGNTMYQPSLLKWIKEKSLAAYENNNMEPTEEKYGQIVE